MCHFGDLAGNLLDCCILFFGGGLEGGAAVLPAQMELKFLEFLMAHRMSKQCLMNEQPNVPPCECKQWGYWKIHGLYFGNIPFNSATDFDKLSIMMICQTANLMIIICLLCWLENSPRPICNVFICIK